MPRFCFRALFPVGGHIAGPSEPPRFSQFSASLPAETGNYCVPPAERFGGGLFRAFNVKGIEQ